MPNTTFNVFSDHLAWAVWGFYAASSLALLASRYGQISTWCIDRIKPILALGFAYLVGLLVSILSIPVLQYLHLQNQFPEDAPGMVSGPDLLVSLLTISALTVSAGFAYLCLPTDRAEMRLASITRSALLATRIEPDIYEEWYDQLRDEDKTPGQKLLKGLLYPRNGMGGWYFLTPEDFNRAVGVDAWRRFSRYVDGHIDDAWIRLCVFSVGTAMAMGLICLFYRYFGFNPYAFHPIEFGIIIILTFINFIVASFIVSLAFGVHLGEANIRAGIERAVSEQKPHIDRFVGARRDQVAQELEDRIARPPGPNHMNPRRGGRGRG